MAEKVAIPHTTMIMQKASANILLKVYGRISLAFSTVQERPSTKTGQYLKSKTRTMSSFALTTSACAEVMYVTTQFAAATFLSNIFAPIVPMLSS